MRLVFPTMLHQSITLGLLGYNPDCLLFVERKEVVGEVLDAHGKHDVRYVHVASERMPFEYAIQVQMRVNERLNQEDERFGQQKKFKMLDQFGRELSI